MIETINSRELSLGKFLSTSWQVYKKNLKSILFIIVLLYTPYYLIVGSSVIRYNFHSFGNYTHLKNLIMIDQIGSTLSELIFGTAATLAIIVLTASSINGKNLNYVEAIKGGFSKWFKGVGTSIIQTILTFLWSLLLIIPGIYWSVNYTFSIQAAVLKEGSCYSALKDSHQAVQGKWWKVFGFTLVLNILIGIIVQLVVWPFENIELGLGFFVLFSLIKVINSFIIVATTVLFLNLDYLKHGVVIEEIEEII
ncbi:MAG: hypothetical protein KAX49_03390 [Halanaerobiales bacterium]|nr:hypothetical protein [Halanaerobiales bacterium]